MKREAFVASLKRKAQFRSVNASNANIIFLEKGLVKKRSKERFVRGLWGFEDQCEFNIEQFSSFKCGAKVMKTVLLNHAKPSHKRDLINKQFDDVEHAYLNALRFEALATRASRRDPCTYNVHMLSQRALASIIFN